MTTFGCAYWGRDHYAAADHFAHMIELGFRWVVIPVSTERMRYDHAGTRRIVDIAQSFDLHTRLSPWGVGGLFGGEGVADAIAATQLEAIKWWVGQTYDLHANGILWDEPHGDYALLCMHIARQIFNLAGSQYLYLNPARSNWPAPHVVEGMAGLGVDAYQTLRLAATHHDFARERYQLPVHVWVRSFGLTAIDTLKPASDIRALVKAGVEDIGIWGYPSAGCSILDNAEPQATWKAIERAIAEVG